MIRKNDFPAINGEPVTEAHSRICAESGHATHTVDGEASGMCPRCGELLPTLVMNRADFAPDDSPTFKTPANDDRPFCQNTLADWIRATSK